MSVCDSMVKIDILIFQFVVLKNPPLHFVKTSYSNKFQEMSF